MFHRSWRELIQQPKVFNRINKTKQPIFILNNQIPFQISRYQLMIQIYNQMFAILGILMAIHIVRGSPAQFDTIISKVQPPLLAKKVIMGHTVNGNQLSIYLLTKMPFVTIDDLYSKNAILLNSYMHARQPYSVDLLKILVESIINSPSQQIDYFLNNGVFIIYPFVNIDGYNKYMQSLPNEKDKLRKNMNFNNIQCQFPSLSGVDINRNFAYNFGIVPQSSDACSEQYHGVAPFSEKQAIVFKQLFQNLKILIALDLHSYGNEWIYPYASDSTGNKIYQHILYPFYQYLIKQLNHRHKTIQSCIKSLGYIADGVYIDWALDQGALSLAYEVGINFNTDNSIESSILNSLQDFFLIFDLAAPIYEVQLLQNTILIHSLSLSQINLVIKLDDIQRHQTLTPKNVIAIQYNKTNLELIQIKVANSNNFNKIIHFGKDWTYLIMVVIFLSILLTFVLIRKYYDKRVRIQTNKSSKEFNAISIEEHSNISIDEIQT